jgi:hypothetical protein
MKRLLTLMLALAAALPLNAFAASPEVGVWRLASAIGVDEETGATTNRFGAKPDGYIIFSPDGYMSVVINAEGRQPISGNPEKLVEEQARLFSTMTAHAGKYKISDGRLIHRVDVAHDPKMVGADLLRSLHFVNDNQLESTLPPVTTPDGRKMRVVLLWNRVK